MAEIDLSTYGGALLPNFLVGEIADSGPRRVETFINESATEIEIGRFVALGAALSNGIKGNCKPASADADLLLGVAIRDPNRVRNASGNLTYKRYEDVPVMIMGKVAILLAETVRRGDDVIVLTTAGGTIASPAGGVAGTGRIKFPGASHWMDAAAAAVGVIYLSGPVITRATT
jgi:hypothetical protein